MEAGIGVGGMALAKDESASLPYNIFSPIEIETSTKQSVKQTFYPSSSTTSMGPFSITIPPDPDKWIDCGSIRLHGRMKISKQIGNVKSDMDDDDNMGTVDNIFHSLWAAIRVKVNGTEITDPTGKWYSYKSLFETKLSYSHDTKQLLLSNQGYCQDTANNYEDFGKLATVASPAVPSKNIGWLTRKGWFAKSKWCYFNISLHSDLTTLRNYLPPNQKLEFVLERNPDSFCEMGTFTPGTSYPIELENIHITLDKKEASPEVQKYYMKQINAGFNPRLTIDRSVIKSYIVTAGKSDLSHYNIISGSQLPEQLIIGIVSEDAFNGTLNTNPYKFDDYDITEASILVNGMYVFIFLKGY